MEFTLKKIEIFSIDVCCCAEAYRNKKLLNIIFAKNLSHIVKGLPLILRSTKKSIKTIKTHTIFNVTIADMNLCMVGTSVNSNQINLVNYHKTR